MATTKVITELTDLNQANSESGLRMPTGGVFSGTPAEGMMRNDTTQASEGSASTMQHYTGDNVWKNFVNTVQCTTATCDYPTTATLLYQMQSNGGSANNVPDTCSNYNGTSVDVSYAAGKFGNAAVFNGSSSNVGISSSAINPANVYSISMWVNFNNASAYTGFFTNNTSAFRVGEISIIKSNATKLQVFSVGGAGTNLLDNLEGQPSSSFVNNTWYNIVVISDRSISNQRAKIFVNGTECSYVHYGANQASVSTYSDTKIGLADGQFLSGKIDQVRIFPSALNQTQITQLANEIGC